MLIRDNHYAHKIFSRCEYHRDNYYLGDMKTASYQLMDRHAHPAMAKDSLNIEAFESLEEIKTLEREWRDFEKRAISSPYQSFDWVTAWYTHVSPHIGETPCAVVIKDAAGNLVALFPLAIVARTGLRIARFPGLSHSNFNMPLAFSSNCCEPAEGLRTIGSALRLDAFWLHNQPFIWQEAKNPLARLPHIPSPSVAYCACLPPSGSDFFDQHYATSTQRKRLRNKKNGLAKHGNFIFAPAHSSAERHEILAAFLNHKTNWFRVRGLRNPFAPAYINRFFEAVAQTCLEFYALRDGERIAATFATMVKDRHMSALFTSITNDKQISRGSPGEILLLNLMMNCADRGLQSFDLGVGEAAYKHSICPVEIPLFHAALPITLKGRIASALWLKLHRLKRIAKKSPRLFPILQRIRSLFP